MLILYLLAWWQMPINNLNSRLAIISNKLYRSCQTLPSTWFVFLALIFNCYKCQISCMNPLDARNSSSCTPQRINAYQAYLAVLVLNLWLNGTLDLFFSASILEHYHLRNLNSHKELAWYFSLVFSYFSTEHVYRNTTRLYWISDFFCGCVTREPLDGKTWFQAHTVEQL